MSWFKKLPRTQLNIVFVLISCVLIGVDNRMLNSTDNPHLRPTLIKTETHDNILSSSFDASKNNYVPLQPLSSVHHYKIIHKNRNDSHNTNTRTLQRHKIIHRLKHHTRSHSLQLYNLQNRPTTNATSSGNKTTGSNYFVRPTKISVNLPSFITNNTRLKRQLEGIFHVRGPTTDIKTSTSTPLVWQTKFTTSLPKIIRQLGGNVGHKHNNNDISSSGGILRKITNSAEDDSDKSKTTRKETATNFRPPPRKLFKKIRKGDQRNATVSNLYKSKIFTKDRGALFATDKLNFTDRVAENADIVLDPQGKRNFSLEIVEIARKTVFNENNKGPSTLLKPVPIKPDEDTNKKSSDSNASIEKRNFFKYATPPQSDSASPETKPFRSRLNLRFPKPQIPKTILEDSTSVAIQSHRDLNVIPNVNEPQRSQTPKGSVRYKQSNEPVIQNNPINHKPPGKGQVEVEVNYQEQIPYNDGEVDEADLKDYLDGHSTFGAKGNFKHTLARNVTGFLPNNNNLHKPKTRSNTAAVRTPQLSSASEPPSSQKRRSRSRPREANSISVEDANVKIRNVNPKVSIYTATGKTINPGDEEKKNKEDKSIFQYTGNQEKTDNHPKLPKSTLDELYRQGHPAVAKPPIHKPHDHEGVEEHGHSGNPFPANPLVDDPPLKFDPESDRFYGEPRPERDRRLAQSNRPEPVRVENQNPSPTPDYQDESRPATKEKESEPDDDQFFHRRAYEPPSEYDAYGASNSPGSQDPDGFIRDFVSLDSNFQRLPRPDDENFRSLVPAEADEEDNRYFEPDNEEDRDENQNEGRSRGNDRDRDDEDDDETTSRTSGRRSNRRRPSESDDYSDGYDNDDNRDDFGSPGESFDASYVDALKQFDDEIKKIQSSERDGTTGNPPTSTGEPLVITSPGPAVSYSRNSAPGPSEGTTQVQPHSEEGNENEDEESEDDQNERPTDSREQEDSRDRDENNKGDGGGETTEEEEEEPEETTASSKEISESDKPKEEVVKINKVVEVKGADTRKDKSGNLDDDITNIESEFGRSVPRNRKQS